MNDETTSQPQKKRGGKGMLRGEDGVPFSKNNQPPREAKKRGWERKKLLKDLLNISTSNKIGTSNTDYRKLTSDYFGIIEEEVTIKMIMEFRQIEKAILKGDTPAYNAIMDRAEGKPKQEHGFTDNDGKDLIDYSKLPTDVLLALAKARKVSED